MASILFARAQVLFICEKNVTEVAPFEPFSLMNQGQTGRGQAAKAGEKTLWLCPSHANYRILSLNNTNISHCSDVYQVRLQVSHSFPITFFHATHT